MKNPLKTILIAVAITLMLTMTVFAEKQKNENPEKSPEKGFKRGRIMEICEKYKGNPEFDKMMEEVNQIKSKFRSERKAMIADGKRPDKEQFLEKKKAIEADMDALKTKYGKQFPDFFEAVEEMRMMRKQRWDKMGKAFGKKGKVREAAEKYKDNPEFQTMLEEIRSIRSQVKKEREEFMKSGQKPDKETIMAKRAEYKKKFEAVEAKYGEKFPDFFSAVKEVRESFKKGFSENCKDCNDCKNCGNGKHKCSQNKPDKN